MVYSLTQTSAHLTIVLLSLISLTTSGTHIMSKSIITLISLSNQPIITYTFEILTCFFVNVVGWQLLTYCLPTRRKRNYTKQAVPIRLSGNSMVAGVYWNILEHGGFQSTLNIGYHFKSLYRYSSFYIICYQTYLFYSNI